MAPHHDLSNSWRLMASLTLLVLALTKDSLPAAEPAAFPGEDVQLRAVPELRKLVSGEFDAPTILEVVASLQGQTGVSLAVDESVIRDRPIQGTTKFREVPAWGVMEQLAHNKYVLGRWRKIGGGYRLFADYKGPPPPFPPAPLAVQRPSDAKSPSEGGVAGSLRWWLTGGSLVAVAAVAGWFVYRRLRKRAAAPAQRRLRKAAR